MIYDISVSKDISPPFLAHFNLCTVEVNVCLCEAVETLSHCWD